MVTPITNPHAELMNPKDKTFISNIFSTGSTHCSGLKLSLYFLKILSKHNRAFFLIAKDYLPSVIANFAINGCNLPTSSSGANEPIIVKASD